MTEVSNTPNTLEPTGQNPEGVPTELAREDALNEAATEAFGELSGVLGQAGERATPGQTITNTGDIVIEHSTGNVVDDPFGGRPNSGPRAHRVGSNGVSITGGGIPDATTGYPIINVEVREPVETNNKTVERVRFRDRGKLKQELGLPKRPTRVETTPSGATIEVSVANDGSVRGVKHKPIQKTFTRRGEVVGSLNDRGRIELTPDEALERARIAAGSIKL